MEKNNNQKINKNLSNNDFICFPISNSKLNNISISQMTENDLKNLEKNLVVEFDNFWNYNILKQDFFNKNTQYFVAKNNDEIVGFVGILIIIDQVTIMNIVTQKNKRKLGIGSLLLEKIIDFSKKNNIKSIILEVDEKNIPGIKLYEKFKFQINGYRKNYYHNGDSAILMELKI